MSYLDIQKRSYYLRSEIDEVVAEWTRLTKEGTEDEMAMYIGKRTMRAIKIQKVSPVLAITIYKVCLAHTVLSSTPSSVWNGPPRRLDVSGENVSTSMQSHIRSTRSSRSHPAADSCRS